MSILQYTIEHAYADNEKVSQYVDGNMTSYKVMTYYEVDGYCNALESFGFKRAYDLDEAKEKVDQAEQSLMWAEQEYETAKMNALVKPNCLW